MAEKSLIDYLFYLYLAQGSQSEVVFPPESMEQLILTLGIILIIWFGTGFVLALLVKYDMDKREKSGIAYILVVLFTSVIGFSVYLVVRYNEKCELEQEDSCEPDF